MRRWAPATSVVISTGGPDGLQADKAVPSRWTETCGGAKLVVAQPQSARIHDVI